MIDNYKLDGSELSERQQHYIGESYKEISNVLHLCATLLWKTQKKLEEVL